MKIKFIILLFILTLLSAQPVQAQHKVIQVLNDADSILTSRMVNNVTLNSADKLYNNRVYYEIDTKTRLIEHTVNILPRYGAEYNRIRGIIQKY